MTADNAPTGHAPSHVAADDLRRLLDAVPGSCLLLSEGRVQVHNGPADDTEGLVVVTRADLAAHLGDRPDDNELTTEAALLDDKIRLLGA
ncbi:MAG TPA: hypothetical protein VK083_18620 [Nocardia sp.]|uniref:hypothetical protein n=1 Tax=Nocardia TaxID=1817 RepID=UPI00245565BA|nr:MULTISPECIES: hypothetical protein [Nocardia]HLS78799.1 hypothetical protein [Nocardia sp.]